MGSYCLWGKIQQKESITRGIRWLSTPSHGGFAVSSTKALDSMREIGERIGDIWYFEEDSAWCAVGLAYSQQMENSVMGFKDVLQRAIDCGWEYYPDWMNKWYPHLVATKKGLK